MAHLSVLVLFGLVVSQIKASGFLGGSMSFSLRTEKPDGSFEVDFYYREYKQTCDDQLSWQCQSGDCGTLIKSEVLILEANSSDAASCQSEGHMTRNVPTNSPFILRDSGCCWNSNVHGARDWSLTTLVDVGTRTDTNRPNRSPVSATVPRLRIPQNCLLNIELLVHDPDDDEVRCKFSAEAGGNSSCSSCHSHPSINLNQERCVLNGNGSLSVGTHVFEMILEDYPKEDITITYTDGTSSVRHHLNKTAMLNPSPISQIPLQFTVEVLSPTESCLTGKTRPQFLTPTPWHEDINVAAVGHGFQLELRAQSTEIRIIDFQISGPQNMSKLLTSESNGIAVATLEWTPQQSDLHRSVPVCFTADTATSQSEMRCVVVMVGQSLPLTGNGEVSCKENIMTITVNKTSIPGIHDTWLHMIDPSCSLTSNDTHVMGTISINTCGTQMEEEGDYIIFKNVITSFDEPGKIITRRGHVTIGFSCRYPKVVDVYSHYLNKKSDYVFTEASFGSFSYTFEVFTDANFTTAIAPASFPLEYELLDMLFMGIKSHSAFPNTRMFVESCRSTPTVNPRGPVYYDLISNGCSVDDTLVEFPHGPMNYNFEIQAFKFTGEFDEVFISCSVILCEAGNPNSRCAQGCVKDASRRRKRGTGLETASHFLTMGPFRVARNAQHRSGQQQASSKDGSSFYEQTNATTFVLAGLFMASLVLLMGVLLYRRHRYRTLASSVPDYHSSGRHG
ncbi:deleted in malignant brain tumors 1 protein-like isoform X1 [Alosa sapidissima]|uniref:deleted in malignant brain tumors 1 protein-like isoform X1 n=1 Tax=Alosa sapidissima TaxID=34773 RepID=UPI001C08C7F9|nr:deleted in malignant brain tumors 1 protein-like isoform X1 [Alosa sapidissima]